MYALLGEIIHVEYVYTVELIQPDLSKIYTSYDRCCKNRYISVNFQVNHHKTFIRLYQFDQMAQDQISHQLNYAITLCRHKHFIGFVRTRTRPYPNDHV